MILLESSPRMDHFQIEESDALGAYAIIRPSEKLVPERQSFVEERVQRSQQLDTAEGQVQQVIDTPRPVYHYLYPKEKGSWTAIVNRLKRRTKTNQDLAA